MRMNLGCRSGTEGNSKRGHNKRVKKGVLRNKSGRMNARQAGKGMQGLQPRAESDIGLSKSRSVKSSQPASWRWRLRQFTAAD